MRGGGAQRAPSSRLTIAAFVSGGKLTKVRFAPVDPTDPAARQSLGQRVIARSVSHILGRIALRRGLVVASFPSSSPAGPIPVVFTPLACPFPRRYLFFA